MGERDVAIAVLQNLVEDLVQAFSSWWHLMGCVGSVLKWRGHKSLADGGIGTVKQLTVVGDRHRA